MDTFDFSTDRVGAFMKQQMQFNQTDGMQGIGLVRDGEMVAGAMFEGCNGHNIWAHLAGKPDRRWMTRAYLAAGFGYAFIQCGVARVSGYVEASNLAARRLNEHLGCRPEAILHGAATDGGDVIIYVMKKEDCRFLAQRKNHVD